MNVFGELVPGETPIDDISGLKVKGVTTRTELNELEAANISKVASKYLLALPAKRSAPFSFGWCLQLHQEMFGDVWEWAGKMRSRELSIGVPSHRITENLENLLLDLKYWEHAGKIDYVEQAARLHFQAVRIHPFLNGNGRWARMLANVWLKSRGQHLIKWPENVIGTTSPIRSEYIAAIHKAIEFDFADFNLLHRRYVDSDASLGPK